MIKRKIIIVNKVLQLRYAGVIIAAMVVAVALIFISTFHYINFNRVLFSSNPGAQQAVFGLAKYLGMIMIFYVITVVVFSLFASHKFAGPLYRFEQIFKSVTEGDLTQRVTLRDKDELNHMRDSLNQMIASLRNKIKIDKDRVNFISVALAELNTVASQLPEDKAAEVRKIVESAEQKLKEFGTAFKI